MAGGSRHEMLGSPGLWRSDRLTEDTEVAGTEGTEGTERASNTEKQRHGGSQRERLPGHNSRLQRSEPMPARPSAAIGRAGQSTDTPRTQAAIDLKGGLCPRGIGRSLAAHARRHRLPHLGVGQYPFRLTPFLRFSELKLGPFPPSPPSPPNLRPLRQSSPRKNPPPRSFKG